MPAEWLGIWLMLAAEPRNAPRRDVELPLELLEYLADMDKAPVWLREAPEAPELDEPVSPASERQKKEAR